MTVTQSTTTLSFNFAAPELIGMCATCGELDCDEPHHDGNEQHKIKTMKTDVYAFGCLYYEVSGLRCTSFGQIRQYIDPV